MVYLVKKTFYPLLPEFLGISLNIPLTDAQSFAYLPGMAQLAQHKVAQYITVIVRVVFMVAKNRRSIVKVINEILFLEKTNAAVDKLRTFREYWQLHLHTTVFLPKFTTVLFTIDNSCPDLLSDSYRIGIRKSEF
jgi:hypothetical protein